MATKMARGNIASQEKGSGARADGGKPDWSLMPLDQVSALLEEQKDDGYKEIWYCIDNAANFQQRGTYLEAMDLLRSSLYLLQTQCEDKQLFGGAFTETIRVWEHGQKKYAAFNWMKGMSWSAVLSCYMRHADAIYRGELIDKESGRLHAAHLVCNAMMLVHFTQHYLEGNDLPIKWYKQ